MVSSIAEATPHAAIHIGGGEPFLDLEGLKELVREAICQGLHLEYVETNGFWIRKKDARKMLEEIREAGCRCLLLSISPFHNAFLSTDDNRKAYHMIQEVFGEGGIFAWHPAYYPFLERHPTDRPIPLSNYWGKFSEDEIFRQLTQTIYLHPAGRAVFHFDKFLRRRLAKEFFHKNCGEELASPDHAHVDPFGNYLTGFCAGLTVGHQSAFDLKQLFTEGIPLKNHPILSLLTNATLGDLHEYASGLGFRKSQAGYISPCHLCAHMRTFLFFLNGKEIKYPELAPTAFYEEMRKGFAVE